MVFDDNKVSLLSYCTSKKNRTNQFTGMSVTVGDFFGTGLAYAAGAPRSNGTGQVVLLTRRDFKPDMDVALILDGEQFASSFGYEITSADVNGDKYNSLYIVFKHIISIYLF